MKKFLYLLLALVLPLVAVSCDEDRDSNPVFQTPTSFVLNTPANAANNTYVLEQSDSIILTTSQPNYGTTMSTAYQIQVSLDGNRFARMSTVYTKARMSLDPKELNDTIRALMGTSFVAQSMPVYVRLYAHVSGTDSLGAVYSNTVTLPHVLPYQPTVTLELPKQMYLIGSFAPSAWNWSSTKPMAPVVGIDGAFYGIYYFAAGDMFKVSPIAAWAGEDRGYQQVTIDDQAGAGITGENGGVGDNLKVANAGWYTVVIRTALSGSNYTYTATLLPVEIYLMNPAPGSWSLGAAAAKFTVPSGGTGVFTSPTLTGTDTNVRIAVNMGQGGDWWRAELTLENNSTIHFRQQTDNVVDNWGDVSSSYLINAVAGNAITLDFINFTGAVN